MKDVLSDIKVQAFLGFVVLLCGGVNFWLISSKEEFHPNDYIEVALVRLGPRDELPQHLRNYEPIELRRQALQAARWAEAVAFPGQEVIVSVEYLYGIVFFRDAMEVEGDESLQIPTLRRAAKYLFEAEQGIVAEYEQKLWYAFGVCLQKLGKQDQAIQRLEKIFNASDTEETENQLTPEQLLDASMRLQTLWLIEKSDESLLKAGLYSNAMYWVMNNGMAELPDRSSTPESSVTQTDKKANEYLDLILLEKHQVKEEFSAEEKYNARILRAQVFAAINRSESMKEKYPGLAGVDVHEIVEKELNAQEQQRKRTKLIQAQQLMEEGKYEQAKIELEKMASLKGLDRTYTRKALFLIGECDRQMGDSLVAQDQKQEKYESAIVFYERTADEYATTHEGVAANLWAAVLHQKVNKNEQALQRYRKALTSVDSHDNFRNSWLSLEKFQEETHRGWKTWIEQHNYDEAIALSNWLPKLFSPGRSKELIAETYKQSALNYEEKLKDEPFSLWAEKTKQMRQIWIQAGKASEEKATYLKTAEDYSEALWESSEQYRLGHDFKNSIRVLHLFVDSNPAKGLARAYVRLGENYMDLDMLDDAIVTFKYVLVEYPTDVYAFETQHLLGKCYFEKSYLTDEGVDYLDLAEKSWRKVIDSEQLTPDALEWRRTLYALGKLYFLKASMIYHEKVVVQPTLNQEAVNLEDDSEDENLSKAYELWQKAIDELNHLLGRFPNDPNEYEARYLLAHSYRRSAEKLNANYQAAETDTARNEMKRQISEFLTEALTQFEILKEKLSVLKKADRLDVLGQEILRNSYFEIAHIHYSLDELDSATDAYFDAIGKYPEDPLVILSYIQIANCFQRLNKPIEAKSYVDSARFSFEQLRDQNPQAFSPDNSELTAEEWGYWLNWTLKGYGMTDNQGLEENTQN